MKNTTDPLFGFGKLSVDSYVDRLMGSLRLEKVKNKKAIDLGCGIGAEALFMARLGYKVDAIDMEARPEWPAVLTEGKGRVKFSLGNAQLLKRPSSSYDEVYEKDMLHHTPDPVKALREMARVTKPGGKVLIVEANRLNPVFYVHLTLMGDHQHFTKRTLKRLLNEAGMGDAAIHRVEARCWPINRPWAQSFFNGLQDFAELVPLFWPFLCYHVAVWEKPKKR